MWLRRQINYELLHHDQLRHHHHQQQQQEQQADDVISLRSADGSNTDSGRGGSELEGDTARHPLPPPAPSSAQPPASSSPTRERADPTAAGAGLCKLCDVTQPARSVPTLGKSLLAYWHDELTFYSLLWLLETVERQARPDRCLY